MIFRSDKEGPRINLYTGMYEFDTSDLEDEEDFYNLLEELLDEVTWNDTERLRFHYNKHVLHEDEEFDPNDPKFSSNMKLDDYKSEAEKLTNEIASTHDDKTAPVIGFKLKPIKYDDTVKSPRYVKIRRFVNNKFFPKKARGDGNRYREAVIYVDNNGDTNIISYMIIKDSRFYQYVNTLFDEELPKNKK